MLAPIKQKVFSATLLILVIVAASIFVAMPTASARSITSPTNPSPAPSSRPHCGDSAHGGPVYIAVDLGCTGKGNPILDMLFAIIRWLSDGVGLVIIGSVIVGGIQYMTSRDNPQAVTAAINRLQSAMMALLIFVFSYAILNYLIPGAILR